MRTVKNMFNYLWTKSKPSWHYRVSDIPVFDADTAAARIMGTGYLYDMDQECKGCEHCVSMEDFNGMLAREDRQAVLLKRSDVDESLPLIRGSYYYEISILDPNYPDLIYGFEYHELLQMVTLGERTRFSNLIIVAGPYC